MVQQTVILSQTALSYSISALSYFCIFVHLHRNKGFSHKDRGGLKQFLLCFENAKYLRKPPGKGKFCGKKILFCEYTPVQIQARYPMGKSSLIFSRTCCFSREQGRKGRLSECQLSSLSPTHFQTGVRQKAPARQILITPCFWCLE